MRFVYPEFLYAFLLLAVPIIIHLFNFKRYKVIYFSSLRFLKKVDEQTKSTQKLKHLLLLALRLLAFSALVLAFAQPYIPKNDQLTRKQTPIQIFYLDNSFGLSARSTTGNLLSQSKELIRKMVDESPAGTNFLLLTNALSGPEQRIISRSELLDRLDYVDFHPFSNGFVKALNTAKAALDQVNYEGLRNYVVISDFLKRENEDYSLTPDSLGFYYPIQLTAQNTANIFIDSVWFSSPFRMAQVNNTMMVRIRNTSNQAVNNIGLKFEKNDYKRDLVADIPANGTEIVTINYSDASTGLKGGHVEVFDDAINFDDTYYFSYEVLDNLNITIIQGERGEKYPELVYQTDDFFKVQRFPQSQLQIGDLADQHLIVLNGISSFSSGLINTIAQLAEEGKSIAIIPSEAIEPNSYNALLKALSLGSINAAREQQFALKNLNFEDPFFQNVFEEQSENIRLPKIVRHYPIQPADNSISLISFENSEPFLIKSNTTAPNYFIGTSLSQDWGDFTRNALFAAVLLRMAESSNATTKLAYTLGEAARIPIPTKERKQPQVEIALGENRFRPPLQQSGFQFEMFLDKSLEHQLTKAGLYNIYVNDVLNGKIAMNYSRATSNFQRLTSDEITNVFKDANVSFKNVQTLEKDIDIFQLSIHQPDTFWRILLILALSFFLLEMILLKYWKV
ncbi:MAG: BatA domain-containing protein [Crocinitomicaceae bacterium]|nr:BatA domain-containing protein [Crocinitomicaceae bacterium]